MNAPQKNFVEGSKICQGILPPPAHSQWMNCAPYTVGRLLSKACEMLWESQEDRQALAHACLVKLAESMLKHTAATRVWNIHSATQGLNAILEVGKGLVTDPQFSEEQSSTMISWGNRRLWEHLDDESVLFLANEAAQRQANEPLDQQIVGAAWPVIIAQAALSQNSTGWFTQFGEHNGTPLFVHLRIWTGRPVVTQRGYPFH